MKLYANQQSTKDLSRFTDDELKSFGIACREYAQQPIILKNISLNKNSKGQLVLTFDTENHKYLKVEYGMWSNRRVNEDYNEYPWGSHCFGISTPCEYKESDFSDGEPLMLSVSNLEIWLEPDTAEEDTMLSGLACILPTKYSYSIAIIPWADLEIDVKEDDIIPNLESDMIYFFEF